MPKQGTTDSGTRWALQKIEMILHLHIAGQSVVASGIGPIEARCECPAQQTSVRLFALIALRRRGLL